jgi:predicted thioesterase
MKGQIVAGLKLQQSKVVTGEDTAAHYGSGLLEVFATPAMVAFLENTCMKAVQDYLQPGEGTVGTNVNISHLKATPAGATVTCYTELAEVNGRALMFRVEVFDEDGKIGEGTHSRFIIDEGRFMKKISEIQK